MDFELPPDAVMLCDMLRRFVEDEAKPLEMKFFTSGDLDAKERLRLQKVVEQMGLWGITVPEKFGGGGLDTVTACLLEEELGKTFVPVEIGDIPPLLYACQGEQIKRFLEPALAGERRPFLALREPGAVRPEAWTTTAAQAGEAYLLNGIKLLSGMPAPHDFVVLFAAMRQGPGVFLLDANQPGLQLQTNGGVTAQLSDCLAGPEAVLGEPGQAFALGSAEAPLAGIRLGARYAGLAQRLLSMAVEYARDWQSLGGALKDRPAVQGMLAELQVQIECTRWLVYHAAWLADRQKLQQMTAAEVRLATEELLKRAADLVTMVFGGSGPSPQVELQRFVRSAIPMEAFEAGLEYTRRAIALHLLAQAKEGEA